MSDREQQTPVPRVERWAIVDRDGKPANGHIWHTEADANKWRAILDREAWRSAPFAIRRLVELRAGERIEQIPTVPDEGVEGVVREAMIRGSMWIMEPAVSVESTRWPIGTRVRVTKVEETIR